MRILLFTDTYYPDINGVATSVFNLKTALEMFDHQVMVVHPNKNGFKLDVSPTEIHLAAVKINRLYGLSVSQFASPTAEKIFDLFQADIIHIHTEFSVGTFGKRYALKRQIPYLYTLHTFYHEYSLHFIKNQYVRFAAQKISLRLVENFIKTATSISVPSQKLATSVIGHYGPLPISVIPNCIDLKKFDIDGTTIPDVMQDLWTNYKVKNTINFLYLGRIAVEKNIFDLILFFTEIIRAFPQRQLCLLIIGDGPALKKMTNYVKTQKLDTKIFFLGRQPQALIQYVYLLGDIFISASTWETQGMCYFEAMASGLPVLYNANDQNDLLLNITKQNPLACQSYHNLDELLTKIKILLKKLPFPKNLPITFRSLLKPYGMVPIVNQYINCYQTILMLSKHR